MSWDAVGGRPIYGSGGRPIVDPAPGLPDFNPGAPVRRQTPRERQEGGGAASDRYMRHMGHREFDTLWKGPTAIMTRTAAYQWLALAMGLTEEEAHFSRFDARQCQVAIGAVRLLRAETAEPLTASAPRFRSFSRNLTVMFSGSIRGRT